MRTTILLTAVVLVLGTAGCDRAHEFVCGPPAPLVATDGTECIAWKCANAGGLSCNFNRGN